MNHRRRTIRTFRKYVTRVHGDDTAMGARNSRGSVSATQRDRFSCFIHGVVGVPQITQIFPLNSIMKPKPVPILSAARLVSQITGQPPPKGIYAALLKRIAKKSSKPNLRLL